MTDNKAPIPAEIQDILTEKPLDPAKYPVLSRISSPADLRLLPQADLLGVCTDIRHFLIDSLSSNPGHFASSMGAVELTVALHYVFNTPYDRIVWDVGHQAYGHKLLTGRAPLFHTNRKLGGLSGFPNPAESEFDTFTAGHASNSISVASGMAVATNLLDENPRRNVVAVIGDASISGGLAFEGLNNIANARSNVLIILNDNDMSIDHNVGSLNSYLAHLTTSKAYNNVRYRTYQTLKHMGMVTEGMRGPIMRFNNSLKSLLTHEQNIFEGLDIRYFGPFDGHDLPRIIRVLNDIKDIKGPRILHLRTVKGKGYKPAEADPGPWHAPGRFDPATGERLKESKVGAPLKYQEVFGHTLLELAKDNKRITGITAAMLSGTSMSIVRQQLPDRVFDVGISEGHAVTFAGGMAKEGLLPYVAIYSSFLQRAYDNIIHDVALQGLPVTFCIDRAGIVGEDGATHHGLFDLSYMRSVPGMVVAAPRNELWLRNLLYTAQLPDRKGPISIRYPRGSGSTPEWNAPMQRVEIGRGECLTQGRDVALLTIGTMAGPGAEAVQRIRANGVDAAHYDMVFVQPLDESVMEQIGRSGIPVVTAEDGTVTGGFGSAVIEWLAAHGYSNPVRMVGVPGEFVTHGSVSQLHQMLGMDADGIYRTLSDAAAPTANDDDNDNNREQ